MRATKSIKAAALAAAVSITFFDCAPNVKTPSADAKTAVVAETGTDSQSGADETKAGGGWGVDTYETVNGTGAGGGNGGLHRRVKGTFTDGRNGRTYKTVIMPDGKIWMAENLNYQTDSSWCYEKRSRRLDTSDCDKYGKLYNWDNAMWACPRGWHLPSYREWAGLLKAVGSKRQVDENGDTIWVGAGNKLKAATDWKKSDCDEENCDATDDYGFSALPGGERYLDDFDDAGEDGDWWAAAETYDDDAYHMKMTYNHGYVREYNDGFLRGRQSSGYSVRCVQD